jgi:hypothetical protein
VTRTILAVLDGLAGLCCFWLTWRSVRTGKLFGSDRMKPVRSEQPGLYWFSVCLFAALGLWNVAHIFRE